MSNYWTQQETWDSFGADNLGTTYQNGQITSYLGTGPSVLLRKGNFNTAKLENTPKSIALRLRGTAGTGSFYYDNSQAVPISFTAVVVKTDGGTTYETVPVGSLFPNAVRILETGRYRVWGVFPNNGVFSGDPILFGFRIQGSPQMFTQSQGVQGPLYLNAIFDVVVPNQLWEFVLAASNGNPTKGDYWNEYSGQSSFIACFVVISKLSD